MDKNNNYTLWTDVIEIFNSYHDDVRLWNDKIFYTIDEPELPRRAPNCNFIQTETK